MQKIRIGANQAGQRLDKFLHKCLPEAGTGFLYKMLRKKNITLNGRKAEGKELLQPGDEVDFYFAEETFLKFAGRAAGTDEAESAGQASCAIFAEYRSAYEKLQGVQIVFEDPDMLVLNKPAGILTQKAMAGDFSLNEWLVGYLLETGRICEEELRTFKPSVCNRLDRNTSGLVLCGKSLAGSQALSKMIRERSVSKYYRTICAGEMRGDRTLEGYLRKDGRTNRVEIIPEPDGDRASEIRTKYHPLAAANGYTLLEVELITGKPHQIRAHLASVGHPIIGDYKYGDRQKNERFQAEYGLKNQLLHAGRVVFPDGRELTAEPPEQFFRIAAALDLV